MELDRQITIMTEKAKQVKRYIYIYTFVVYACMYASLSGVMLLNYVNLSVYNNGCMYVCIYVYASLSGVMLLDYVNLSVYINMNFI